MTNDFHLDMNEYLPLRDVVFNTLRQAILTRGTEARRTSDGNRTGSASWGSAVRLYVRLSAMLEQEGLVIMIPQTRCTGG